MTRPLKKLDAWTARQLLWYDASTGRLRWKPRSRHWFASHGSWARWNARYAGQEALVSPSRDGYLRGRVLGKTYLNHRVLWLIHAGQWPLEQIDHINGRRSDNRLVNLRCVSPGENGRNKRRSDCNKSGVTGVHWYKPSSKWMAHIAFRGQSRTIGYYDRKEDAVAARKAAEVEYGFHPNHGRVEDAA